MEFPQELKYSKDHEWVKSVDDSTVYIGITDFAQSELGDIVYVDVETEGETLIHGEVFGTVEAVKTVSDLYMPISGEILAFNQDLEDEPEKVNEKPYEDGWMIKVKMSDPSELEQLMSAASYKDMVE
jgi:glycine cleavage system H protein